MRSLFLRIFLTFWGATVVIGGLLVVLALTTDPRRADFERHQERLIQVGGKLVEVFTVGGTKGLRELARAREADGHPPAFLFRGTQGPLSELPAPPMARRMAARASATGDREVRRGRNGLWLAMPLEEEYVIVAEVPLPSRLERLLDPYRLTPRLGLAFLVVGLVSYLLARSLSAPIQRLREATQELAEGDLSVRVGETLRRRRDETAQLGRDFDRMAERIEALVEAQRRLLRDISHELRSPLARLGVALGLARQKAGPGAAPALDRIEREAERLNELIGQLLTLTLLESGPEGLEKTRVDLGQVVRQVARDADFEARSRGSAVEVVQSEGLVVDGFAELLRRAIENVVRNAVRFTEHGSAVEIRLTRCMGPAARIEVRDHGPGVPEGSLEDLFRPFYRVADARDRASGGAGVGLAIAERAVTVHGGSVRAGNAPGGGLSVVIELPIE